MGGEADIGRVAALIGEPARARILLALDDGRALPASVLASEASVAASTASEHLASLVAGGLLAVEQYGRHRYFRIASPAVGRALESLARIAPLAPVRSLRDGTRAQALRLARTCYDHLAGRLGVGMMAALLERGLLEGGDGLFHAGDGLRDCLSAAGQDVDYRMTPDGVDFCRGLGIDLNSLGSGRPVVRYCVDWTEQRHHLSGALGAALARQLLELGWLRRAAHSRVIHVTEQGREQLRNALGLEVQPA